MRADKVLRAIIRKKGLSIKGASVKAGRSRSYIPSMFSKGNIPKIDTMADLCDHLGWDLLVRDRSDGFEIHIDPK